jgi:hypothetical protein
VIDARFGPGVVTHVYTTPQYRHRVSVAFDAPDKLSGYVNVWDLRAERPGAGWVVIEGDLTVAARRAAVAPAGQVRAVA